MVKEGEGSQYTVYICKLFGHHKFSAEPLRSALCIVSVTYVALIGDTDWHHWFYVP